VLWVLAVGLLVGACAGTGMAQHLQEADLLPDGSVAPAATAPVAAQPGTAEQSGVAEQPGAAGPAAAAEQPAADANAAANLDGASPDQAEPSVADEPVSNTPVSSTPVFSTGVQEVVLHATVTDEHHRPVMALDQAAFQVLEDGKPQRISTFLREDVPVSLAIVIDNSGSMRDKRRSVNEAAMDLVLASNPQDQVCVVNFNDRFYLDQDFTADVGLLRKAAGAD
jgi:Ca-activated chloride channel homolog